MLQAKQVQKNVSKFIHNGYLLNNESRAWTTKVVNYILMVKIKTQGHHSGGESVLRAQRVFARVPLTPSAKLSLLRK